MVNREFILCQYSFVPFPHSEKNPKFALGADVYAHIPYDKQKEYNDPNHALGIWLDIKTQEWVVRKEYFKMQVQTLKITLKINNISGVMFHPGDKKTFKEIYRGKDLQEALNQCTILSHKYWDSELEWTACTHTYELYCCKKYKDKYAFRD